MELIRPNWINEIHGKNSSDTKFHGSDDNASGTAAVWLSPELFHSRECRESVVFIFFAGEELGLLGSRSFVLDPPLPLDSIIAMLNFDMVCRGGYDTLYIGPEATNSALYLLAKEKAMSEGFRIVQQNRLSFGGSDHQPFLNNNIPALHFFTGLHADYHQVTITPIAAIPLKPPKWLDSVGNLHGKLPIQILTLQTILQK